MLTRILAETNHEKLAYVNETLYMQNYSTVSSNLSALS